MCFARDDHQVAYGTFLMSVIFVESVWFIFQTIFSLCKCMAQKLKFWASFSVIFFKNLCCLTSDCVAIKRIYSKQMHSMLVFIQELIQLRLIRFMTKMTSSCINNVSCYLTCV